MEDEVEDRLRDDGGRCTGTSGTVAGAGTTGGPTASGFFPLISSCRGLLWGEISVPKPSDSNCSCRIASFRSDPLLVEAKSSLGGVGISNPGGVGILNPCSSLVGINSFGGKIGSVSVSKLPAFIGLGMGLGTLKGVSS